MSPRPSSFPRRRASGGFSLVELLVGVLIALVGVLIMMQTLLNSEERNRTTTAGTEALSNGAVMLHMISRDVLQGGYGMNSVRLLGCNLTLPSGAVVPMGPAMINPADPASTTTPPAPLLPGRNTTSDSATNDTLFIPYGSDNGQPEGNPVLGVNGSNYVVQSPSAFAVNDWVVATPATCPGTVTLARVTAVDQATASVTVNTVLASATALHNLGQAPRFVGYMVRDGALQTCDFMAANGTTDCRTFNATNWTSLSTNMPVLRAQYGRDSNAGSMDGAMDVWDQTPDATLSNTCRWARINAVRFAVVARSSSYESRIDPGTGLRSCEQVTQTARTWAGSTNAALTMPGTDWQCYRYRVFETVVPSRNVIWMGNQGGSC